MMVRVDEAMELVLAAIVWQGSEHSAGVNRISIQCRNFICANGRLSRSDTRQPFLTVSPRLGLVLQS